MWMGWLCERDIASTGNYKHPSSETWGTPPPYSIYVLYVHGIGTTRSNSHFWYPHGCTNWSSHEQRDSTSWSRIWSLHTTTIPGKGSNDVHRITLNKSPQPINCHYPNPMITKCFNKHVNSLKDLCMRPHDHKWQFMEIVPGHASPLLPHFNTADTVSWAHSQYHTNSAWH